MLILSILMLFAGPLLYQWLRSGGKIAKTFDRLIVGVLVIVVAFLLVPESFSGLGITALLLMAAGYLVPGLLESAVKGAAHTFHLASLLLALLGLMLHALLDGAGLAGSELGGHSDLAIAIILHRFGVGLVLWMLVQPAFGKRAAFLVLILVSVATVLGFSLSEWVLPLAGERAVLVVQALIIGAIIHSLIHRGHMHHEH